MHYSISFFQCKIVQFIRVLIIKYFKGCITSKLRAIALMSYSCSIFSYYDHPCINLKISFKVLHKFLLDERLMDYFHQCFQYTNYSSFSSMRIYLNKSNDVNALLFMASFSRVFIYTKRTNSFYCCVKQSIRKEMERHRMINRYDCQCQENKFNESNQLFIIQHPIVYENSFLDP